MPGERAHRRLLRISMARRRGERDSSVAPCALVLLLLGRPIDGRIPWPSGTAADQDSYERPALGVDAVHPVDAECPSCLVPLGKVAAVSSAPGASAAHHDGQEHELAHEISGESSRADPRGAGNREGEL